MDPITKALHETWKNIVTESSYSPSGAIIGGLKDPFDRLEPDGKGGFRPKKRIKMDLDVGLEIGPNGELRVAPKKPKPTPTPGDGSWGGPQPKKPKYGPDGNFIGFDDGTTPTPTPKPKYPGLSIYDPMPKPRPDRPRYWQDGDGKYIGAAREAARRDENRIEKDYFENAGPGGYKSQPAVPATTGSGLLNSVLNTNKKMYNMVTGSLPSMPKIYEERDAEGQMAMGELKVLAQKAQELAGMMKDDTQLEAWVQSKITKAKDYISSVHDYMNGNPDKID